MLLVGGGGSEWNSRGSDAVQSQVGLGHAARGHLDLGHVMRLVA